MMSSYDEALDWAHKNYHELAASPPSMVGHIERHCDLGPGRFYFVRLPDGHLLDCGADCFRAYALSHLLEGITTSST